MKKVLTIAGSDCSGGAGIQADIKTIAAQHMYAMSVITALTAQNTTDGIYDLWMTAAAARGSATQFLAPTPETTLTIPSTAAKVISVGAYDSNTNTYAPFSKS